VLRILLILKGPVFSPKAGPLNFPHLALHAHDGQKARELVLPRTLRCHQVDFLLEYLALTSGTSDDREAGFLEQFPDFMFESAPFRCA
jgi:hypothetical protein